MAPAICNVDEEAAIEALLAGIRPARAQPPLPEEVVSRRADRAATHDEVRDRLVLDAALGTNLWAEEVQREEVDFVEEQEGGFAASVSVVLSLVRSDDGGHMHDETGSGREQPWRNPDPSPDAATATQRARVRALACARKRLAGRFWRSLDANVQRAVEDAARREVASRRRL